MNAGLLMKRIFISYFTTPTTTKIGLLGDNNQHFCQCAIYIDGF